MRLFEYLQCGTVLSLCWNISDGVFPPIREEGAFHCSRVKRGKGEREERGMWACGIYRRKTTKQVVVLCYIITVFLPLKAQACEKTACCDALVCTDVTEASQMEIKLCSKTDSSLLTMWSINNNMLSGLSADICKPATAMWTVQTCCCPLGTFVGVKLIPELWSVPQTRSNWKTDSATQKRLVLDGRAGPLVAHHER